MAIKMPPKPVMFGIASEAVLYFSVATSAPPNPHLALIASAMAIWLLAQFLAAVTGLHPVAQLGKAGRTFLFCGVDAILLSALFEFGPGLTAGVLLAKTGVVLLFKLRKEQ